MREIPPVSKKLKALQDAMEAQEERKRLSQEKISKALKPIVSSVASVHQNHSPTLEDEYLMSQFQSGRYCGD